jgi:hypothetical protein
MVVLDLTVMNIALPSAQRALHFIIADRQWVVAAYTGVRQPAAARRPTGRPARRKVTFPTGLAGLADVWAIGGASVTG